MCRIYGFRVSGLWIPELKLKHVGDRFSYPCFVGHGGIKHELISARIMWQLSWITLGECTVLSMLRHLGILNVLELRVQDCKSFVF